MVKEQITFACGQILPGFGPINFPGDEPGNPPFVPGGDDPPVGPPVIPPITPSGPPDGPVIPPGGGGGPPGEEPPGGGGVIPPDEEPPGPEPEPPIIPVDDGGYCRCYIVGAGAPTTGEQGKGKIIYKQQCERVIPPNAPTPNSASFEETLEGLRNGKAPGGGTITGYSVTPPPNQPCPDANNANECCDGDDCCPDICITWTLAPTSGTRIITNEPEYPSPGGKIKNPAPRKGGGGSVLVNPGDSTPTKPRRAGAGIITDPRPPIIDDPFGIVDAPSVGNISSIDLGDPEILGGFSSAPGLYDPDITVNEPIPPGTIENTSNPDIFIDPINAILGEILEGNNTGSDWNGALINYLTPALIIDNLKPDVLGALQSILNYDGTPLTDIQIYNIIGSKVVDGTINGFGLEDILNLANYYSQQSPVNIKPGPSTNVNEIFALNLIESFGIPLDEEQSTGRFSKIISGWKVLPTDVDTHFPFELSGECEKLFIMDNDCVVELSSPYFMRDGSYVQVDVNGVCRNLPATTERDHSLLMGEKLRQQTLGLLGGNKSKTLSVAGPLSGTEFNASVDTPRQDFYLLSAVPDSVSALPNGSPSRLVKTHKLQYRRADVTTASSMDTFKYKANFGTFILNHEDVLLDYLDASSSLYLQQDDIIYEAPKTNKTIPVLTRQIPPWLIIVPSNRPKYLLFNTKSKINDIQNGVVTRELNLTPSLDPILSNPATTKFISYELAFPNTPNVYGEYDTETRITVLNPNQHVYQQAFEQERNIVPASQYTKPRRKTVFRLIKEIITELDTNYVLEITGQGKGVNAFDIFSRLNLTEYNRFIKEENEPLLFPLIKQGLINSVKIFDPVKFSGLSALAKTRLLYRRDGVPADQFKQIKSLKGQEFTYDEEGNISKTSYTRKPYTKR